jgi:hypothetical protein
MVKPSDILWGRYKTREGPMFGGVRKFTLSENPSDNEKYIAVLTATEGGYDAINCYDSCILSVGLIQLCEVFFLVSNMLGFVAETLGTDAVLVPLKPALDAANATFRKNPTNGKWRFAFNDERGEVTSAARQRELFLSCSGDIGSWTPESKAYAKLWAASMANVFATDDACRVQLDFLMKRIRSFVLADAAKIIFDGGVDEGWKGAFRAGFISFSANLPSTAQKQLLTFTSSTTSEKWSSDWCIGALKQLTFGPAIGIYPIRYDKIAPLLKRLWKVELPLTAAELKAWEPAPPEPESIPDTPVPPEPPEEKQSTPEPQDEVKNSCPIVPQPTNTGTLEPTQSAEKSTFDWLKLVFEFIGRLFKLFTGAR